MEVSFRLEDEQIATKPCLDDLGARGAIMSFFGAFLENQKIAPDAITKNRRSAHSKVSPVWAKASPARYVNHVLRKMPTSMAAAQRWETDTNR